MPKKKTRTPRATRAEVAAYCTAHPGEVESLAEMLPKERAEHVARMRSKPTGICTLCGAQLSPDSVICPACGVNSRVGRPNDLPRQPHEDSLRSELEDLLGMLDFETCEDPLKHGDRCYCLRARPTLNELLEATDEARALLHSILGHKTN